jgi:hypothetical protein
MRAFHGQETVKQLYLDRLRDHRECNELIQGYGWWNTGRGSATGCTVHSSDESLYVRDLGIPAGLAHIKEHIFQQLTPDRARLWPEEFVRAIAIDTDLAGIGRQYAAWLLGDPVYGVIRYTESSLLGDQLRDRLRCAVLDLGRILYDNSFPPLHPIAVPPAVQAGCVLLRYEADRLNQRGIARGEPEWDLPFSCVYTVANAALFANCVDGGYTYVVSMMDLLLRVHQAFMPRTVHDLTREAFWLRMSRQLLRLLRDAPIAEEVQRCGLPTKE